SKNVSKSHLDTFYSTFEDIKDKRFDGMIITGAPIEHLQFENVNYWPELVEIMEWTKTNVISVLHICWGAQAALYHHYGIDKYELPKICFGIFEHTIIDTKVKLVQGFEDVLNAPHSRYTQLGMDQIKNNPHLKILALSEDQGMFLLKSKDEQHIMITVHLEYDAKTLRDEYERDIAKGVDIDIPENYFPADDPEKEPLNTWRAHTHLLFSNWLNYYVYQETPYTWVEKEK